MSHTIRAQYDLIADQQSLESDFKAMLDWLSYWEMKPCNSAYFGEEVNSILVRNWIEFRNSLSNSPKRYEREYLEGCARDECEPDDFYEIADCMDDITDGQLMAIGRLFYGADSVRNDVPELITTIAVRWGIEDVQSIRADLTDEQASAVLQAADRCHNAEVGINWDVLRFHADAVFPEEDSGQAEEILPESSEVNSKYADSIIAGNPSNYYAIEVHGVRNINDADDPDGTHYEVDDENPELYSVYLHCAGGGIECVGDFSTHELALAYANELSSMYSWRVMDFAEPVISPQEKIINKNLKGFDPVEFSTLDWDLVGSIDLLENCRGEVVCFFTDSYLDLEEAALNGAVYFGSQPICNRGELEGALIGHEMTVKATGVSAQLFFVRTD
jgi:hypothetical protein